MGREEEEGEYVPRSPMDKFVQAVTSTIDGPITWFRESIVLPNHKKYPWYHRSYNRVPTIDQCYTDDAACRFEADQQYRRDRMVESEILNILRQRFEDCTMYERPDHLVKCDVVLKQYKEAAAAWFTKYGDLGGFGTAKMALMKQKHRMIWERRHGPVGTGMKHES